MLVCFVKGKEGNIITRINGVIAVPDRDAWYGFYYPKAGEIWDVGVMRDKGNILFLRPVKKCGLRDIIERME
jgi:hypothetical protein